MFRRTWLIATALGAALALPAGASAQTPGQDSVTGTAATGAARSFAEFTFDVHSGPSGENPTGTVTIDAFVGMIGPIDVTCLSVDGNRASMFAAAPPNNTNVAGLLISVEDGGPGQDKLDWRTVSGVAPSDCPVPSEVFEPIVSGDITVTDAPPLPTTKDQCRQGGWRTYGFKNQGECVSFVTGEARKACIFELVAHGHPAFRAKYGIGPGHWFAMWACVHRRTGF
jgi:hypothetical protein